MFGREIFCGISIFVRIWKKRISPYSSSWDLVKEEKDIRKNLFYISMKNTQKIFLRYILHHASPWFGDCLITLLSAYSYAYKYKVPLIIDWRNAQWLDLNRDVVSQNMINFFEYIFDNRDRWWKIPIITNPQQIHTIVPHEVFHDMEVYQDGTTEEIKAIYSDNSCELLQRNYSSDISGMYRPLVQELKFAHTYMSHIKKLRKEFPKYKKMVWIHVRLSNGEWWRKITKYTYHNTLKTIKNIIQSHPVISPKTHFLYITSDTPDMIPRIQHKFSQFQTYFYQERTVPKYMSDPSHVYLITTDPKNCAMFETILVEMIILRYSHVLLSLTCYDWISGFVYYARNFVSEKNFIFRIQIQKIWIQYSIIQKIFSRILCFIWLTKKFIRQ